MSHDARDDASATVGTRPAAVRPSPDAVETLAMRAAPARAATTLGVGPQAAATVAIRPPPPAAARTPGWGEIEPTTNAPTLRENIEELDLDARPGPPQTIQSRPPAAIQHASPERIAEIGALLRPSQPPRPSARPHPATRVSAPEPAPAAKKAVSRAWGEVDLDGVSSGLAHPVSLDASRPPPPHALDPASTLRDPPRPTPSLPPLPAGSVYYCEVCRSYIAPERVVAMSATDGRVALPSCPQCGRFVRAEASAVARSLDAVLLEAVLWPFSRENAPTLVGNALVFWVLSSLWLFRNPLVTPLVLAAALGVLATYAAAVIRSTARGDDAAPPPSDAISSWDVAGAVLRHAFVFGIGGAPLLYGIVSSATGAWGPSERTVIVVIGAICFCLYVPAGQIVAATRETFFAALNPFVPVRFAWRIGANYLLASAILFAFALAHLVCVGITMALAGALFGDGFFPGLLWGLSVSPVVVVGVLVEARMLGLVVREHRFDLSLL